MTARSALGSASFQISFRLAMGMVVVSFLAGGARLQSQTKDPLGSDANVSAVLHFPKSSDAAASAATGKDATAEPVRPVVTQERQRPDRNRNIYYKNKLEFSFESGWLPNNIPFVFDFMLGNPFVRTSSINYTLLPNIFSLRWQMGKLRGPWALRGIWESSFSGAVTIIPRGAETRYFAYDMGIRRYFVQRNWRVVPYLEGRLGMGDINAGEPRGIPGSQGQNFTFTVMLGSGLRYNFNPRYAMWAGVSYMHVSNLYLSEPRYPDYGINVYGPMFGVDVTLGGKNRHATL